jgi:hypothetical protein
MTIFQPHRVHFVAPCFMRALNDNTPAQPSPLAGVGAALSRDGAAPLAYGGHVFSEGDV